jgi:segregation and condensation protein B
MPPSNLLPAIEALLFSSDQPLPLALLSESLDVPAAEVASGLHALAESYAARDAGVEVREIAGGWMIVTAPAQSEWVGRLLRGKKKMRLSRAALETMAIIAYKQPVTKSEIEAIRGVDSSGVMATLLERNLVTIRGRSKLVGRPLLYGTTQEFLDYFGLRDLSELPRPEELRALVAAREPEQLDMMELEVVSQVAGDLERGEARGVAEWARGAPGFLAASDDVPGALPAVSTDLEEASDEATLAEVAAAAADDAIDDTDDADAGREPLHASDRDPAGA